MITSRRPSTLLALVVCAGIAAGAPGQTACNIPDDVARSRNISESDRTLIRDCVNNNRAALAAEYDAVRRARVAMLAPLRVSGVSIEFRAAYSAEAERAIAPLVRSERDDVAINALRIAGELGTEQGARLCAAALADKRPGVRMMAAAGLARTFSILHSDATMTAQQIVRVLSDLAQAARSEPDPLVLDGLAMTYEAAFGLPTSTSELAQARNRALLDAATEFGKRARDGKLGPEAVPAMLRISLSLREPVLNSPPPPANVLREVSGMAGDFLAHVLRRTSARDVGETERAQLGVLVAQSENLVSFAARGLNTAYAPRNLSELVASGRDTDFARRALDVIGAEGELTKQPFGHPRDRFVR
ncbi:MAG: hypothetical protein KF869_00325 [Phycisphaeraceae bacterium]|nr:hypothetical protein [Phycisphaeraceae bacterium]